MDDNDQDDTESAGPVEGFSDAEIEESLADFREELDSDYAAQFDPLLKAFETKDSGDSFAPPDGLDPPS